MIITKYKYAVVVVILVTIGLAKLKGDDSKSKVTAYAPPHYSVKILSSGGEDINDKHHVAGAFCLLINGKTIDLGKLGDYQWVMPAKINNDDQVVGQLVKSNGYKNHSHAFLWFKGKLQDIDPVKNSDSGALDINGRGQVVGVAEVAGKMQAFLWESGHMRYLGAFGGKYSHATGINNKGQIIGEFALKDFTLHGFLWADGKMQDLVNCGGNGRPRRINNKGEIIGTTLG